MRIKRLTLGPYGTNCYIVAPDAEPTAMIIDPGYDGATIDRQLQESGLSVKYIVLTHGHMDHTGALAQVKTATGADVCVHAEDSNFLPVMPDRALSDGDTLELGDESFLVLHTPGHSPGSICLLGGGVLFSGDTLFNLGIGRYDFHGGSYGQIMNSLQTKLMVLPGETEVFPGHGPETTIENERRENPFLRGGS